MRAELWALLLGVGGASLALSAGCGGGGATGSGGAGGSGGGPSSSSVVTSTSTSSSTSSSSTGGPIGDGNDTFDMATPLNFDEFVEGDLDPTLDVDFYTFDGKKGQPLFILAQAQGSNLAFDPDTINTVITLYDANKKQIAENNDRVPLGSRDSELFTILPADGKYYLKVWECFTWSTSPNAVCGADGGTADKLNYTYNVAVLNLDPTTAGNIADGEAGDNEVGATPVTYSPAQNGGYYLSILWGGFKSATDVDVFEFQPPGDAVTPPPGTVTTTTFNVLRPGENATGSTSAAGKVWITTKADPLTKIAEIDGVNYQNAARLSPQLDFAQPYLIWVQHPNTAAGTNDFYFLLHGNGYSNPLETDDVANDLAATAELLTPDSNQPNSHYIEGTLDMAKLPTADVDNFKAAVPAGTNQVAVACTAQRSGSGLRGFKARILNGATQVAQALEQANTDAFSNYASVPAGATELTLEISAMSQDAAVTSNFYRCGFHFRTQ